MSYDFLLYRNTETGGFRTEGGMEDAFCEMLDECYPDYEIGYSFYTASEVMKNCDPIAFRCGLADYKSEEEWEEGTFTEDDDTRLWDVLDNPKDFEVVDGQVVRKSEDEDEEDEL